MLRNLFFAAAVAAGLAAAPDLVHAGTFGNDYRIMVINGTSDVLWELYASNRDTPVWEADILGGDVIMPGDSMLIDVDDGSGYCVFDLKAVFGSGEVFNWGTNVCVLQEWTITE